MAGGRGWGHGGGKESSRWTALHGQLSAYDDMTEHKLQNIKHTLLLDWRKVKRRRKRKERKKTKEKKRTET